MSTVNVPTNPKQRDISVENKLRLYGIYNAFLNGKLPSNTQIDIALSSFTSHPKLRTPNTKLSDEGRLILEDFCAVVDEAKRLLLVKNHDQALQEFIWNASQLGQKGVPAGAPGAPVNKESANKDAQRGVDGLKTLGTLIITNGQFRKLLDDALILLREVAGDAATRAAGRVAPSEEQLRQIDDPAADHEWHDAPNLSRDSIKQKFRSRVDSSKSGLQEVTGNATQAADPSGPRNHRDMANRAAYDPQSGINAAAGIQTGFNDLQQRVSENISEEHKQKGREYRDHTRNYLHGKMPKERREQTIWRLKKMVIEIQSHQGYSEAIETLLSLAETYTGHVRTIAEQSTGAVKDSHQDSHLRSTETNLKVLLERFANNTSSDDLFDAINDVYRDADRDLDLKSWFRSVDSYIHRCLQEEGYILQPQSTNQYYELYDQGSFLLRNRYRDHTDRLMDEARFLGDQFSADPENRRFGDALQKLFNDLGNDENEKPTFKKHLVKDLTQVIVPDLLESIRYVPIPRIEYSDAMFDAVVENLVLESDNLMPNELEIGNDSYFRFGRRSSSNKHKQQIMVSASQIQCDLRDVSYYIKRKRGFPSITDTGVADIFMGGDGFGFKLSLSTAGKTDRARFFKVDTCKVFIKNLQIKLKKSHHKTLFSIFKPLLLKVIKPVLVRILEQQIRHLFTRFDAFCYRIHQEEQRVKSTLRTNPDPETAQNIYSRYYKAFQNEMLTRKQKLREKTADMHANVAVTTDDSLSIFRDIQFPGGISTRATELRAQAAQGDRWENDVFSIGSAGRTQGLPSPTQVQRKSPFARRAGVRERGAEGRASRDSGYQAPEGGAVSNAGGEKRGGSGIPVALNRLEGQEEEGTGSCRYEQPARAAPYVVS